MKKVKSLCVLSLMSLLFLTFVAHAQSPQAIPYQAVARDVNGGVLANQTIALRVTLIDSNINAVDYQETHQVTTNALGLFTFNIGEGTPITGSLAGIYWPISGNEHVQVEMDPTGGTNYVDMGITKLNSVPFALHANTSSDNRWSKTGNNIWNNNTGNIGIGLNNPSGKMEIAPDPNKDELVIGEPIFNSNDAANRIQVGNTNNSSFIRLGQTANNFLSVGWLFNPDVNQSFGQVSTFDPVNPLILQRFGGNVGIGTLTPSAKLDVNGMGFFRNNPGGFLDPSVGAGIKITTENNQGNIFGYDYSNYTPIDLILQSAGGKVGIGVSNPDAPLHVLGNMHLKASNYQGGDGIIFDEAPYAGNGHWVMDAYAAGSPAANKLRTYNDRTGITVQTIMDNGNVGIGDFQYYESALAKLDVKGNIKIADGTEGAGKVLTSDANGLASWMTPSGGGVWSQNGNDISNSNSGKVGIGTTTPSALLDVNGDALINGLTVGRGSGNDNLNAVLGFEALASNTGAANTAIGYQTLKQNTTGFWNTAIGGAALTGNTSGKYNIAIGVNALASNTTGNYNTAIGTQSMITNVGGEQNTAFGFNTLTNNTSGNFNTALGLQALFNNTTGQQNTAVGLGAMQNNTEGSRNTSLGMNTLLANTTGNNNTAIGRSALIANTSGSANTSVGERTLILNQTGSHNTAIGDSAALNYLSGDITAIGYQALSNTSTGEQNVAVGYQSLKDNTIGAGNTAIGYQSLSGNTSGSNNVAIGNNANVSLSSLNNTTVIGANAQAAQSNSIVLGSIAGVNGANSSVNVGIGTNTPQHTLSVGDATADTQSLTLRSYSNSPSFWKGGAAFGYNTSNVIMGELSGVATIGAHDGNLSNWADLSVNTGGGNVGIGTSTPAARLDVNGDGKFGNYLKIGTNVPEGYFQNAQDGAYRALQTGGTQGYWFQNYNGVNTSMYVGLNGTYQGKVGIGTTTPSAKLDVVGSTKTATLQITNGASNGAVLTSDASGNANWTATNVGAVIRTQTWTAAASGTSYAAGSYLAPATITATGIYGDTRLINSGAMNTTTGSASATGIFTAPADGYYQVSIKAISVASSVRLLIAASLNGAVPTEIVDQLTSNPCANCSEANYSQVIYMQAGDTHRILRSASGTAINDMIISYRKL